MLRGSNYGNAFKNDGQSLTTTLIQTRPCSDISQTGVLRKALNLNFKFESNINLNTKTTEKEQSFATETITFEHQFQIVNDGRSPTDMDNNFNIFVPQMLQGEIKISPKNQAKCSRQNGPISTNTGIVEELKELSCDTVDCSRFNCSLKQGLDNVKTMGEGVVVKVQMKFNPQNSYKLSNESFEIVTTLEMDNAKNKQTIASRSTFKENKNDVGSFKSIREWWPILLGVILGGVLFGGVMYGLYRKGIFQKVRLYDQMED